MLARVATTIVWSILLESFATELVAQDIQHDCRSLYNQWRKWAQSLQDLAPRRIVYELSEPNLLKFGYAKETVESYTDGKVHFSRERVGEPIPGKKQEGKISSCQVGNSDYFAIIERPSVGDKWAVNSNKPPKTEFSDQYKRFLEFPGDIPRTSKSMDELYTCRVLESGEHHVRAQFLVKNPKMELYHRGNGMVDKFEVTFSESSNWLPTQVDRHFTHNGAGDTFWWCADYRDWQDFEGIPVPRLVTEGSDRSRRDSPFLTFRITELSRVPLEDVVERANLEFYGLPVFGTSNSFQFTWTVLINLIAICIVVYLIYRSRKARQSEN